MISTKQRAILQGQIWKIANDVRGAVDGWDFKQYVLGTLFKKETNNNVLLDSHIEQIISVFDSKENIDHFAKSAPLEEVVAKEYNLSVSSYVEAKDNREVVDIAQLNAELKFTVAKIDQLRKDIDAIIAEIEGAEQVA